MSANTVFSTVFRNLPRIPEVAETHNNIHNVHASICAHIQNVGELSRTRKKCVCFAHNQKPENESKDKKNTSDKLFHNSQHEITTGSFLGLRKEFLYFYFFWSYTPYSGQFIVFESSKQLLCVCVCVYVVMSQT